MTAFGAVCTCRHCGRAFAFVPGFHPAHDVCFHCGPLDVRRQAEDAAAELRGDGEAGEPVAGSALPGAGERPQGPQTNALSSPASSSSEIEITKRAQARGRQKDPERSPVCSDEAGTSGGVSEATAGCSVLTTERAGGDETGEGCPDEVSQGRSRGELAASPALMGEGEAGGPRPAAGSAIPGMPQGPQTNAPADPPVSSSSCGHGMDCPHGNCWRCGDCSCMDDGDEA